MRKTTITCNKCGKAIERGDDFITVSVTEHSNGARPAMLGWSDTDNYDFCNDCHQRDEIKGWLYDLVKVPRKNGGTHWVKREELPRPPVSAVKETMSDD